GTGSGDCHCSLHGGNVMNLQQWHERIAGIAAQVSPDTRHLPAGRYVLVVENCPDCDTTPVTTCHNCGGGGELRYWMPFDEVLEAALSKVGAGLMDKQPAVERQEEEGRGCQGDKA